MKNKKAQIDEVIKKLAWVVLFVILLIGLGFLLKKLISI